MYLQKKHENKDSKVKCQGCDKELKRRVIRAVGFSFHPECFKCSECKQDLSTSNQFITDENNRLYCKRDYNA